MLNMVVDDDMDDTDNGLQCDLMLNLVVDDDMDDTDNGQQ